MSTIVKPKTWDTGGSKELTAADLNSCFDTIYNDYNGNVDSDNLAANAVTTAKIINDAVTAAKLNSDVGARYFGRAVDAYDISALTEVSSWTNWDISSIVPANCVAIAVKCVISDDTVQSSVGVRPDGVSDTQTSVVVRSSVVSQVFSESGVIPTKSDNTASQTVEYRVVDSGGSGPISGTVGIAITGYWVL